MESSRIFVRGLPPNLSSEDFQRHFSKASSTTDAKLFPHRRIGYVGYKTHDEAYKAVKYFNKSYIRMSRIEVELARPIEPQSVRQSQDRGQAKALPLVNSNENRFDKKRKRDAINEDGMSLAPLAADNEAVTKVVNDDRGTVSNRDTSKRQKQSPDSSVNNPKAISVAQASADQDEDGAMKTNMAVHVNNSDTLDPKTPKGLENPPASDAEWLRSRTSRLLGLLDDDEVQEPASTTRADASLDLDNSEGLERQQSRETSDAGKQTEHETPRINAIQPDEVVTDQDSIPMYNRIFIRNLAYDVTEPDLREQFETFGTLEEVSVPRDPRSDQGKGFAFVQYLDSSAAKAALTALDGQAFHGRLLHILPSPEKKSHILDDHELSKLPVKKQKQIRRKAQAASSSFEWNSLYMNADAVMSSISDRLGIAKSELLDPTSSNSAVKQAHAETSIIQETKSYFSSQGVNVDSFKTKERVDSVILVKNFPYGTQAHELKQLFEVHGNTKRVILPPSGTIAIIEFETSVQGKSAFGALAYRKFKESVLFLEKGPKGILSPLAVPNPSLVEEPKTLKPSTDLLTNGEPTGNTASITTLFVKNLNFSTTTENLRETFAPLDGFLSARIKTKPDPKTPGATLSMGFGFVEFRSKGQADAAMAAMNSYNLDGHDLLIRASHRGADVAEERRKDDNAKRMAGQRTKIIIKNLPFETTKKDVRSLFGAYGKLRSVRVPKKFDNSTRGFAFADFVTAREAENAMDALSNTHLLGRRLVLNFAAADSLDPEEEIEKMQKKMGKQADKVAIQRLTGSGRKKFNVDGPDEDQV